MKKLLLLFLLAPIFSFSQIVNIPDPGFKTFLISNGVDTNSDGEIQVLEAQAVTSLYIQGLTIASLEGIDAFANLEALIIFETNLVEVSLSGFNLLEDFFYDSNESLTSIVISDMPLLTGFTDAGFNDNVVSITISNCQALQSFISKSAEHIDLSGQSGLEYLNLDGNVSLTTLDVTGCTSLQGIVLMESQLTSLDVSNFSELEEITIMTGPLTSYPGLDINASGCTSLVEFDAGFTFSTNSVKSLDFSGCSALHTVYANNNMLESINLQGCTGLERISVYYSSLTELDFSDCPNLTSQVDFNPAALTSLNIKNGSPELFIVSYLPSSSSLHVCQDESDTVFNEFITSPDWPDLVVDTYCTLAPGGPYNTITGTVSFDDEGDGCIGDSPIPNFGIGVTDGVNSGGIHTSQSGEFTFYVPAGEHTLSGLSANGYFNVTSETISFADDNYNTASVSLCATANGVHPDLEVVVYSVGIPMPGFDSGYTLLLKNNGNQLLTGNETFNFDEAIWDYVSSTIAATTISSGQLQFDYNLQPFQSSQIYVTLNLNGPTETPPVNIGDIITVSASAIVANDETPDDNSFTLTQTVVGSYDPNDKTCLEGSTVSTNKIGEYLHYLIRFENTGTAPAQNVIIADEIDAEKFDIGSIQVLSLSHDGYARVNNGKLEFFFEGIQLPYDDENNDGYVLFKIKTKNTLVDGDSVSNSANIYFDYNFPIQTNDAVTTFSSLGLEQHSTAKLGVYPNPGRDLLNLSSTSTIENFELYDMSGRIVKSGKLSAEQQSVNVSDLARGIYLVKAKTGEGVLSAKWVKE